MAERTEYTPRVTKGPDGVWRWIYVISRKQHRHALRITMTVVGAVAVFLIVMAAVTDRDMMWVTALSGAAATAVAGLVCLLFDRLAKDGVRQPFELSEDWVRWVGTGRTDFRYSWGSIRRVRILPSEDIIEVRQLLGVMQVYVPREDFSLVRDLILSRIPGTADVEYE